MRIDDEINKWTLVVCDFFNTDRYMLLKSRTQRKVLADARKTAMYLIKKHVGLTNKHIGELFGGRDPSTVSYNIKTTDMKHVKAIEALAETKKQEELALDVE